MKPQSDDGTDIDRRIKEAQLEKLRRELRGWDIDRWVKLAIALLTVAGACFVFYPGLPKAQIDLANALTATQRAKDDAKAAEEQRRQAEVQKERYGEELRRVQQEIAQARDATAGCKDGGAAPRVARAARPLVFIQFAGDLNRSVQIDPLRTTLSEAGFTVPAAERIDRGQVNEVRYFIDAADERAQADKVARRVADYFERLGCPLNRIEVRLVRLADGRTSPLEVWLQHSCRR
jgi:hypothetical protein